jgi:hypothetical protein
MSSVKETWYPQRVSMIRKYAVVLIRTIHFALGASLGTFSMFWFTSEIRDFNGFKTPMWQQVIGTALVVAAYMGVAALATRDVVLPA